VSLEQEMEWQMAAYEESRGRAQEEADREAAFIACYHEQEQRVHDAEQALELAIDVLGVPGILVALAAHMTAPVDPQKEEPF
jgi:hypothetical protein